MKAVMDRRELLKGMQRVQGVVEKRHTMPILSHILIEGEKDQIRIFATDLEIGIEGRYAARVVEPGKITFSARKLYDIIRELPDGEVSIETIEGNWVVVRSQKAEFKMPGLPAEDFPVTPNPAREHQLSLDRAILLNLIRKTIFAAGENDARYILNGVLLQVAADGKGEQKTLRFVGTDGHRLAVAEEGLDGKGKDVAEVSAIIPKKAILEIKKLLEEEGEKEVTLAMSKSEMLFQRGTLLLTARQMEGVYPNYQQVIPKENEKRVAVGKEELEGALRRVSILSREKTSAIKFDLSAGRIRLVSNNPEMGEAKEEVPAAYSGDGFVTGFNARYLLDVLSALEGEEAILQFKDPLSPCLIHEEKQNYTCVIMPMRI